MSQKSVTKLVFRMLRMYDVRITHHTVDQTLRMHPEYPSMQSISDALDSWKVRHVVMKLSMEKLQALGVPVIAQMKKEAYVWVSQVSDTKVCFRNASGRKKTETRDNFEKQWSGVALAIEDITDAGEQDYRHKRLKEIKENIFRYGIAGSCMALLILLTCFSWASDSSLSLLPKILLLLVNATGCMIGYFLIRQEKNQTGDLVQKFCKAGAHIDCNQVTKSRYSKMFGLISWAETGMAYFTAVTLWVAVAPISAGWLSPLWLLLLVPLPFTVWSLFTQAFLIRKWCLFCCATVFLLWINAVILYLFFPLPDTLPVVESVFLALLILACTVAVMYFGQTNTADDIYAEQRETARIKYDYQTIQCHLAESRKETNHAGFVWGNAQSSQEITLYVSIACSHCGKAVKELSRLIEIYPDFCFRIIFAVHSDGAENRANIITRHFIRLYKMMHKNVFFDMMDAWYTTLNKNLEALQKTYPVGPDQDCKEEIDALYQFSRQSKISHTPVILINGCLLSKLYAWQDLYGIARAMNHEQ